MSEETLGCLPGVSETPDGCPSNTSAEELPTLAPGDVVQLAGVWGGDVLARVRERTSRGLVVDVTGILFLVLGGERPGVASIVVDVSSIEPWRIPPTRARRQGARG